jgi:hypothetical protein
LTTTHPIVTGLVVPLAVAVVVTAADVVLGAVAAAVAAAGIAATASGYLSHLHFPLSLITPAPITPA